MQSASRQHRSFKLTIGYDGTEYAGWQVQPGRPTVQQSLQQAIRAVTGQHVSVIGSGRTDAGVHAIGQVASCSLARWRASAEDLMSAINSRLPPSIVVRQVEDAAADFHAIRDATGKLYRYQLRVGGGRDVFDYRYRWHLRRRIDFDHLRDATQRVLGRKDFASFQASGSAPKLSTVRDVRRCELVEHSATSDGATHASIEVEADGFLYNMVRNIVGTLVEVGRGKHAPEWIEDVLAAKDRRVAGPTAPPHGLFLVRVDYDEHRAPSR